MHITVKTSYDLQYLTMRLSGYINSPAEPAFVALRHGMEYLMHHPHEPIIYSRKKNVKTNDRPHQCFFKVGDEEVKNNQEYSNALHTYYDAYHAIHLYDIQSVTSTLHLFNGTLIGLCTKKQYETSKSSSN